MSSIKNLSEIAKTLSDTNVRCDQDACKITILFPLIEFLGYDATKAGDILLNPAYTEDGSYKLDYGLRGEEDSIKTVIKMIDYGAESGLEFSNIRKALSTINHVEYVVITDCFHYEIYANADDGSTFLDIISFELASITEEQSRTLQLLSNPTSFSKQDFALDEEGLMEDDDSKSLIAVEGDKKGQTKAKKKIKMPKMLPLIFTVSLCACMIVLSVIFAFSYRRNPENWYKIVFKHDSHELHYHVLSGSVSASTYKDKPSVIHVTMSNTNVQPGINITFLLTNLAHNASHTVSILSDTNGVDSDISIPAEWMDCDIQITASVVFDSSQTAVAIDKYGIGGNRILQMGEGDKFEVGNTKIFYDHTGILQYIKQQEEIEAANKLQAAKDFFKNYTIVKYGDGSMCFYPKGYDTDDWPKQGDASNKNITSKNKAYARIKYNAATQDVDFYFIVGTLMQSAHFWSAGGTIILSDGGVNEYTLSTKDGNFYQHVNFMSSITGWCIFTETGVGNLYSMLKTVYSSENAVVEFKGGLNQKMQISEADKKAVLSILDLYDKYFSSETISLDPRWFEQ